MNHPGAELFNVPFDLLHKTADSFLSLIHCVMSLSLSLQTLDSLTCNGNEDLEQLQLEMRDLRHEVRRLKVEPPLSEQISWLGCSAVALHGGGGVACPSGGVTSLHSVHSQSHRSLSPSTLLNCLFVALSLKGKLICTQSRQSLLSRELMYLKSRSR